MLIEGCQSPLARMENEGEWLLDEYFGVQIVQLSETSIKDDKIFGTNR